MPELYSVQGTQRGGEFNALSVYKIKWRRWQVNEMYYEAMLA